MDYTKRKIVKRKQIALRRILFDKSIAKKNRIFKYLGMNNEEFKSYIESKFIGDMCWGNFPDVWELGHVIPAEFFDQESEQDLKMCWNYKNIIPIYKKDNKLFGACLLFSELYFKNKEGVEDYKQFINNNLNNYYRYIT